MTFQEQRAEPLDANMDDFVRKPYRYNAIYACQPNRLGVQYMHHTPVGIYRGIYTG